MGKKQIRFDIALEETMITGRIDLLKQIWVNLIDNAVKFSSPNGKISIRTTQKNHSFIFEISDNGIGMDEQTKKKIFDRFYQGDISHATDSVFLSSEKLFNCTMAISR